MLDPEVKSIAHPRTEAQLAAALDDVRRSPTDGGPVELICTRPEKLARKVLETGQIDPAVGLVGDTWSSRPSKKTGAPNPNAQLTLMNIRAVRAIADEAEWILAGDNLYVDLDLSPANMPAGTRLVIGEALVEITEDPHTGCDKFTARFGSEATKWVNSKSGRELNLRGINAKVIRGGAIKRGDVVRKA